MPARARLAPFLPLACLLVALVVASASRPSFAQDSAAALSARAKKAAQQKRWCESMDLYLDAHTVAPNVRYLYNAAEVGFAANARAEALSLYKSIEANYPAFDRVATVRQRIEVLTKLIAESGPGRPCPPREAVCGDFVIAPTEQCDDGNVVDGDGCDGNCTTTTCGNGVRTGVEACDDGNLVDRDRCQHNGRPSGCGYGILTPGEQCDDGNLIDHDGCDSNCTVPMCGNGTLNPGEACDDGNRVDGDGCDSTCLATGCGSGAVTAGEQCDDGNPVDGDGCDRNCTATSCGNGVLTAGEECDDGNLVDGDGCDSNCTETRCGNGVVTVGEQCDDGNAFASDGCDPGCLPPNEARSAMVGTVGLAGGLLLLAGAGLTTAGLVPIGMHAQARSKNQQAEADFREALTDEERAAAVGRALEAQSAQRQGEEFFGSWGVWSLGGGLVSVLLGVTGVVVASVMAPPAPPDQQLLEEEVMP